VRERERGRYELSQYLVLLFAAQDGREGGPAALRSAREGRRRVGIGRGLAGKGGARYKVTREGAARGWAAG
jgi:hypothetical protein